MDTNPTTVVEDANAPALVLQYVVLPLAVFGAWKLGAAGVRRLRDRRAVKASNQTIEQ